MEQKINWLTSLILLVLAFGCLVSAVNCMCDCTAINDKATTVKGSSVTINVLSNDNGDECYSENMLLETEPIHGTATLNDDGTVTYEPNPGFYGKDSFEYRTCLNTAWVYITVRCGQNCQGQQGQGGQGQNEQ